MSTDLQILLISLGINFVITFKFGGAFYLKRLIYGKKGTFKRMKPFDCFTCMVFWTTLILLYCYKGPSMEIIALAFLNYIASSIINKHIES